MKTLKNFKQELLSEFKDWKPGDSNARPLFSEHVHESWLDIYNALYRKYGVEVISAEWTGTDGKKWHQVNLKDRWNNRDFRDFVEDVEQTIESAGEQIVLRRHVLSASKFFQYDAMLSGRKEGVIEIQVKEGKYSIRLFAQRRSQFKPGRGQIPAPHEQEAETEETPQSPNRITRKRRGSRNRR